MTDWLAQLKTATTDWALALTERDLRMAIYDEMDTPEALDPAAYTPAQIAAIDTYARASIADLVGQDQANGHRGDVDTWRYSAGEAGDMVLCRCIDWLETRGIDAQDLYDEAWWASAS